jgi:hypothetical protein
MSTCRAVFAAFVLLAPFWASAPVRAQDDPSGTSYITPFPEGDTYKLQAYGDAYAEGLLYGLTEAFTGDNRVHIPRKHRVLPGVTRQDWDEEIKSEEGASRETVHIGVIMVGAYDRNHIRTTSNWRDRLILASDEWREEYGRRADRLMKVLKRKGVALYWVGQPVVRRYEAAEAVQMMNDVVREKAYLNGVKFIDIQAHFADEAGNYSAYGPDISGKQRLLREGDGVLFTPAGNRKLAHFVEQEIKRDLTQAKNERAIPLAGSDTEQKRIAALKPKPASTPSSTWKSTVSSAKDGKAASKSVPPAPASTPDTAGEQKADNSRITLKSVGPGGREEAVTVEIVRPAIPSAVIALITRKETGDRASQMGDVVADDVGGGLVVLSSITPAATGPGGAARRTAPSQTPYYQVLIKGDRLVPKQGRADDFSWPKAELEMPPEPPAPARRLPRTSPPKASPRT